MKKLFIENTVIFFKIKITSSCMV